MLFYTKQMFQFKQLNSVLERNIILHFVVLEIYTHASLHITKNNYNTTVLCLVVINTHKSPQLKLSHVE